MNAIIWHLLNSLNVSATTSRIYDSLEQISFNAVGIWDTIIEQILMGWLHSGNIIYILCNICIYNFYTALGLIIKTVSELSRKLLPLRYISFGMIHALHNYLIFAQHIDAEIISVDWQRHLTLQVLYLIDARVLNNQWLKIFLYCLSI